LKIHIIASALLLDTNFFTINTTVFMRNDNIRLMPNMCFFDFPFAETDLSSLKHFRSRKHVDRIIILSSVAKNKPTIWLKSFRLT